jgi:hypothetical protein
MKKLVLSYSILTEKLLEEDKECKSCKVKDVDSGGDMSELDEVMSKLMKKKGLDKEKLRLNLRGWLKALE